MAYIDLTKIVDRHANNIITKDASLAQLALDNAEVDTRVTARENEVKAADIPLTDPDQYLQSEMLYIFCKWRFIYHLFSSVAGSYENDDIYGQKLLQAQHQSQKIKDDITYEIITEEEVVDPSSRNQGIPIL